MAPPPATPEFLLEVDGRSWRVAPLPSMTPARIFPNKIATLKGILPARNPGQRRRQVSMVYYTEEDPTPSGVVSNQAASGTPGRMGVLCHLMDRSE